MDMKQLATFLTLSHTLNYQKTAEQLQYAPSTLCNHIQMLEQELGVTLFCKSGRQMLLTAEGQRFVEDASRILSDYHAALERFVNAEEMEESITIGGCEMNTANSLLPLFTRFSQTHPKARMSMFTSPNAGVPGLVRNNQVDLGYFYCMDKREHTGLQTVFLYQEPLYIMASQNNPISKERRLSYESLEGKRFVHTHDSCCFTMELLKRLRQRGIRIEEITYLGGVHLVVEQAHKEGALTLVARRAAERFADTYGLVRLDVDEEPIRVWETILYKNFDALSPLARSLVRHSVNNAGGPCDDPEFVEQVGS